LKLINKIFAATFLASISLPTHSQINRGFEDNVKNNLNSDLLIAEGSIDDESGTLKISVTGTRTPREIKDVPASVNVISQEEIIDKGVTELKDIFRYDAAVDLKSESDTLFSNYGQGDVSIRGFSGNRILMQRDSIRLPAVYSFGTSYNIYRSEMVDFNSLKGAEILKGPASSLYGSDALGGVVTFQSLFPEDLLGENENTKFDTLNKFTSFNDGYSSALRYAGRDDESGLEGVIVLTKTDASEPKVKADKKYINDISTEGFNIYTNLVKNFDDYTRGNLIIENVNKKTNTVVKDDNLPSSSYTSAIEDRNVERTMISATYEFDNPESDNFIDYFKLTAYTQYAYSEDDSKLDVASSTSRGVTTPAHKLQNDYDLKDDSYGANLQLRSDFINPNVNHRLTYGIDYSLTSNSRKRAKIQTGGVTATTTVKDSPDSDTTLLGIYLQDEISFNNSKWEIIPGIRFDYYDLDSTVDSIYLQSSKSENPVDINKKVFNPSLSILHKTNENLTLYGKYNRGFRAPQYSEINTTFGNLAHFYYIINNPDLKSETSDNFEVGINGDYEKFDFGLNGFWSNFDNRIDSYTRIANDSQGYARYQFQNKDKAEIYGIEFNSNYNFNAEPSGFSLINSAAWTVGNDTSTSSYTPLTSIDPFKLITGLRFDSESEKWGSELIATYTGVAKTSSTNTYFVPDASTIFDLISYYNVNDRLSLDIGLYNIFDTKYYNYQTVKNESPTAADLDKFSEPGANVKLGFKFIF